MLMDLCPEESWQREQQSASTLDHHSSIVLESEIKHLNLTWFLHFIINLSLLIYFETFYTISECHCFVNNYLYQVTCCLGGLNKK